MTVRTILETALNANAGGIDVAWENRNYVPTGGVPYQEAFLLYAQPENPTLGDNFFRENGIFQITLQYPQGAGPGVAETRALVLRGVFKRGQSFTDGTITVTIAKTAMISEGRLDGDRWSVPLKIPFFSNIFA